MNRKIIFFARAGKCGGFGASGLTSFGASPPNILCSFSNDASAIEPSPIAHWLKKCRRVMSRNTEDAVASPSPLNGERAGVRGEKVRELKFWPTTFIRESWFHRDSATPARRGSRRRVHF